ncbi:hypothetical protein GCM10009785_28400 [Brooklawnia cerclae]|uniref:Pyruvate/2-oxoglutarate dehydrogenase complex dihydrolipoamide acyltransferase (E2) component n=1 Tax=Brooklawnia cerclae TaxID=349934 RepID=A0ABX0SER0_9ACTN|nr:biotin/lipoyl-containing protein [Brooklawnia cerclae]NIH56869.1 pyruvate/2-oxoglutarate dehydrogenase complex dihydrolipoamide acyltransferase (E2) component [Brooklawnia cerclae]
MAEIKNIVMPKWGMTMTEGEFVEWSVSEGDTIAEGDKIAEAASDKAEGEVESPVSGTVRRLIAESGETYPVGALIGVVAGPEVSDTEIDAHIKAFEDAFVPEG